jgi:hypothetical protein
MRFHVAATGKISWVVAISTFFAIVNGAHAQEAGDTVTTDVVLGHDIVSDGSTDGLVVGADGITIDGNGHSIIATARVTSQSGIHVGEYRNVTIRNVREISGFSTGIYAKGDNITIENCGIKSSLKVGILLSGLSGATVQDCVVAAANSTLSINDSTNLTLSGNTFIGSRAAIRLDGTREGWSLSNNRLLHQVNDTSGSGRLRMLRFTSVTRSTVVGGRVDFTVKLSTLTGETASGSTLNVRTLPEETVSFSRSGDSVSGFFYPGRNGTYSVVAEVTDAHGNVAVRSAKVLVGPTVSRDVTYYFHSNYTGPTHGQTNIGHDRAPTYLTPPDSTGKVFCSGWVQLHNDEMPNTPPGLLEGVGIKALLSFDGARSHPVAKFELSRLGDLFKLQDKVLVPSELGTDLVEWAELEIEDVNWLLDYPQDWYSLMLVMWAPGPSIWTGDPAHYGHPPERISRSLFHYAVTTAPEVRSISDNRVLLLSASQEETDSQDAQLTFWAGDGEDSEVTLAGFPRPLRDSETTIDAGGATTRFSVGPLTGETTLTSVSMEVVPTSSAVVVEIGIWPTSATATKTWTENSQGSPGTVGHAVLGLLPGGTYRVTVNGFTDNVAANSTGTVQFNYSGSFPATFSLGMPFNNQPPIAEAGDHQDVQAGALVTLDGTGSWDPDADLITYRWSQASGPSVSLSGSTTATPTVTPDIRGTYVFELVVSDGDLSGSDQVTVVVSGPSGSPPVAADDTVQTLEDTSVAIDVLANDSDPDGDAISIASVTQPANGTLGGSALLTYTPDTGFTGIDTFTYTITDLVDGQDTATVTVTVPSSGGGLELTILQSGDYQVATFDIGASVYANSNGYRIREMPQSLQGELGIRTDFFDYDSTAPDQLVFEVNEAVDVYVAYEENSLSNEPYVPAWMSDFVDTGAQIESAFATYRLYRKSFGAGQVVLGGNERRTSGARRMYWILVFPGPPPPPVPAVSPRGIAALWCLLVFASLWLSRQHPSYRSRRGHGADTWAPWRRETLPPPAGLSSAPSDEL